MSNNILNDIENAIYETHISCCEANFDKPKLVILFSHEGYQRARCEKMASCFFGNQHGYGDATFAGYPYEEVHGQTELFKVKVIS